MVLHNKGDFKTNLKYIIKPIPK